MTIFGRKERIRNAYVNAYESYVAGEVEYGIPHVSRLLADKGASKSSPPLYRINVKLKKKAS